jgi:hypothetical protein
MMQHPETKIAVLGDSRTLDTYYYNSNYEQHYGYDRTFHFLLRKSLLLKYKSKFEVVHIPDHFRGHSVENNILRLALTDPNVIILCNGIWETLVNKEMFIEYAVTKIKEHDTRGGDTLELKYDSKHLADLFISNQLSNSPDNFIARQRQIVSYFRRRQRQCILMNLVVPNVKHLNRVHLAGNFRCIPEWDECLEALNQRMEVLSEDYGIMLADIHKLVMENGGLDQNLMDQWHFTPSFHVILSKYFKNIITQKSDAFSLPSEHISHRFILKKALGKEPIVVFGTGKKSRDWIRSHPKANIEAVIDNKGKKNFFQSIQVKSIKEFSSVNSNIVVLTCEEIERQDVETSLLKVLPRDKIILYPEELDPFSYKSLKGF